MNPLIDQITDEIKYWKQGKTSFKSIEEFVRHEINGLSGEQQNQILNSLNKLFKTLKEI